MGFDHLCFKSSCKYKVNHMPRPRRLNDPVKLNLLIDRTSKDIARKIASDRGISISRLFEAMVAEETPIPQEISTESLQDSEAA